MEVQRPFLRKEEQDKCANKVAKITSTPRFPTTLDPVVKRPTPITEPAVMVTASRMPKLRLRQLGPAEFDRFSCDIEIS